jgi:hypothetical protein
MKNYLDRDEIERDFYAMKKAGRYFFLKRIIEKMESKANNRLISYDELLQIYYKLEEESCQ